MTEASAQRSPFDVVTTILRSTELSVEAANRLDAAYWRGIGQPDGHKPIKSISPEKIGLNLAGLYAADTAANVIAAMHYGLVDGKVQSFRYVQVLRDMANGDLDDLDMYILENACNLSWRAGQPLRDMSTEAYGRLGRDVNKQFNLLPDGQTQKDAVQGQEGARILIERIEEKELEPA
jgi:hypothetical protein